MRNRGRNRTPSSSYAATPPPTPPLLSLSSLLSRPGRLFCNAPPLTKLACVDPRSPHAEALRPSQRALRRPAIGLHPRASHRAQGPRPSSVGHTGAGRRAPGYALRYDGRDRGPRQDARAAAHGADQAQHEEGDRIPRGRHGGLRGDGGEDGGAASSRRRVWGCGVVLFFFCCVVVVLVVVFVVVVFLVG